MESANIKIHLADGSVKIVSVKPTTTLDEILAAVEQPSTATFYNEGETPMPDHSKNLVDYNNWCIEKGYLSSLYLK